MEDRGPSRFNYAERFHCIGSACEDTCCQGWKVPVDREAFERFQGLPDGPLRALIHASVERVPQPADGTRPASFAVIRMAEGNRCPMLAEDRLCRIQNEHGAGLLPHTCATYPRIVRTLDGDMETALTLSCPEAARLVLLNKNLLPEPAARPDASLGIGEKDCAPSPIRSPIPSPIRSPIPSWKSAVRDTILRLAVNRSYPLSQRLFLVGILCRRLDALASEVDSAGEPGSGARAILAGFVSAVDSGALRGALCGAMDALPTDGLTQLDALLRLAGLMLHKSNVGPRFAACAHAFTTGIGNGPDATLESLARHYAAAYRQCFLPFFNAHPHILENLLVNSILCLNFPFAVDRDPSKPPKSMARQFAILAAQFALVRGLLIGVAGYHREQFSADHVVHTVQSASKHFEHHPDFGNQVEALLAECGLNDARGLTILLDEPAGGRTAQGIAAEMETPMQKAERNLNPEAAAARPN